jgi:hypothetical protein
MHEHLRILTIAFSLTSGISPLFAQSQSPPPEPQQRTQQENWQHTPSGKMGKEEPSSHAPSANPLMNAPLVNGSLAVPGAPQNTDTVPAKFSEKNAADDRLPTIAYTFESLNPDQRRAIYAGVKNRVPAGPVALSVGTQVPAQIELLPVPEDVAARVPQTRGYQYIVASNDVLLVSPLMRVVVGAFSEPR